ncbi:MAG: hypothetical protein Q8R98_15830, partial [Rubrivivax sp.]|nr:hypothetical protein [Rubrivivax sp.]
MLISQGVKTNGSMTKVADQVAAAAAPAVSLLKDAPTMHLNDLNGLKQYTACIFRAVHATFRIHRLHPARADVLRH